MTAPASSILLFVAKELVILAILIAVVRADWLDPLWEEIKRAEESGAYDHQEFKRHLRDLLILRYIAAACLVLNVAFWLLTGKPGTLGGFWGTALLLAYGLSAFAYSLVKKQWHRMLESPS